jgi:phage tail sheath protein FI
MAFQLSPGVNVSEIDLTNVVPAVSTSTGGFAGTFGWGPANVRTLIDSENKLVSTFGKPTDSNFTSFFSAANFLAYTNNLRVVRASNNSSTLNATANTSGVGVNIDNESEYELAFSVGSRPEFGQFYARYAGDTGNTISVSMCSNPTSFKQTGLLANTTSGSSIVTIGGDVTSTLSANSDIINIAGYDYWVSSVGSYTSGITSITVANSAPYTSSPALATLESTPATSSWVYATQFDSAPGTSIYGTSQGAINDELHVVVIDTDGKISGERGTVLEKFAHMSKAGDAKTDDGSPNYYPTRIFNESKYIYVANHATGTTDWGTAASGTNFDVSKNSAVKLSGGKNGTITDADIVNAYDLFGNSDEVDISLLIAGDANLTVADKLLNLAFTRKDCVAFLSPLRADAVSAVNLDNIISYRNSLSPSTSYAVMDSAWKYQFDKYNNKYRYVPLNADTAGLCARTDNLRDPWWSPAGFNRGQVMNAIKLSWNPSKPQRDELYKNGVNPVCAFPGEGIILYGDKTLQAKASAFDRINVRRLFIVLEKAIATAAKYSLFEFNDQFTRAQFVAMVEPFLRDVKGRRGIYDFKVICDESNNTSEVIDTNRFVGDIYIKPARSINFIQLNFVAVRTGVEFSEVAGKF